MNTELITPVLDIVKPEMDNWTATEIVKFFKDKKGYENVPDFMIRDVYKSYFNKDEEMRYQCSEHMFWWHEMLQNTNNYLLKTVTESKPGHSFIAMKHIIKLLRDEIEKDENLKNQANNGGGDGNDQGQGGGQPDMSQANQNIKDNMEQAVKNASDEIEKKQEESDAVGGGDIAGKGVSEITEIEDRVEMIKDVMLSKKQVGTLINKSIKGFKKGFGSKTILTEESLFEADTIEDLIDEHYLFSELLAMDVSVRDSKQQMTAFDLYIDVSGSMDGGMNIYGKNVNRLQMAIALAARMNMMGCLGEVYAFSDNIKKIGAENIWHLRTIGGTQTEKCMVKIKKNGRPSVILTDGCDHFHTYTENAFIMTIAVGVGNLHHECAVKMAQNGKYIQFDGKNLVKPNVKKRKK